MATLIMCSVRLSGFTRIQLETFAGFLVCLGFFFFSHTRTRCLLNVYRVKSEHHGLFGTGLWSSFEGNMYGSLISDTRTYILCLVKWCVATVWFL